MIWCLVLASVAGVFISAAVDAWKEDNRAGLALYAILHVVVYVAASFLFDHEAANKFQASDQPCEKGAAE